MAKLYHWITRLFKRKRRLGAEDIERLLPPAALQALRREADFLKTAHRVEVASLAAGEKPGTPHAADPEVEARLKALF